MRILPPINLSLLKRISDAKEITKEELRRIHTPPLPAGVVSADAVMFEEHLAELQRQGYIAIEGEVIKYLDRNSRTF